MHIAVHLGQPAPFLALECCARGIVETFLPQDLSFDELSSFDQDAAALPIRLSALVGPLAFGSGAEPCVGIVEGKGRMNRSEI